MGKFNDVLTSVMNDPTTAMAIGLLSGSRPGGSFGQAAQQGLLNYQGSSQLAERRGLMQHRQQMQQQQMQRFAQQQEARSQLGQTLDPQGQLAVQAGFNDPIAALYREPSKPSAMREYLNLSPEDQKMIRDKSAAGGIKIMMPDATERKSASFGYQMDAAKLEEERIEASGNTELSTRDYMVSDLAPEWIKPYLLSDPGQERLNMMSNWGRANLRDESGAVIGVEEMVAQFPRYFPMEGDTEAVKQQKARARRSAEKAQGIRGGRAAGAVPEALPEQPKFEPPPGFVPMR